MSGVNDVASFAASALVIVGFFTGYVAFLIKTYVDKQISVAMEKMHSEFVPRTELELKLELLGKKDD